jgi:RNA 2',3'-cyclic 3'-phosphodiesterase
MSDEQAAAWRCFVAVPLDEELRGALRDAVGGWRDQPDTIGLRWAEPIGWHVTLAFLGAMSPAQADRVAAVLRGVATSNPAFTLPTGGVGAFPSRRAARVAWYRVHDDGRLAAMAEALRSELRIEAAPFRAHVTLARSSGRRAIDLRPWIARADPPEGRLRVERLALVRSHLGRGPAHYETLASASLSVGAHV